MKTVIIRDSMNKILVKIKQMKNGSVMSEINDSVVFLKITCVMDNNERIVLKSNI